MQREYHKWYSPSLGRDMELLIFGHAGAPVLMFPTSMGRFYECEDMGMINALADKIEAGFIQVYCVDSVDIESWYNWYASPGWRIGRHVAYDRYLHDEVLPLIGNLNSNGYLITAGCSFGAFQAANFAFRHPWRVHKVVAMSGRYNMRGYLGDYYDDNVYFNSPLDYISGMQDGDYKNRLQSMHLNFVAGGWDLPMCINETRQLHELLNSKGVGNNFEVWDDCGHDWHFWFRQIRKFI
ncbi:MAG TPA: alpha/beta hydrolase-fold protein [Chloroflexia bacterium]|nr:alpha/beta hydrolase-fold protein [Chloroflexia bacterium]